ncbi:MAG: hypothetical protein ACUVQ5_00600 [Candidatus Methanomethylicaceae archaeon]
MRILSYARVHCEDRCPAERDPEVCLALIELCKELGVKSPPCVEETEGFGKGYFLSKIREIEKRRGKSIRDVLKEFEDLGVRNLEEDIDRMEGEFALKAIKAINERAIEKRVRQKS